MKKKKDGCVVSHRLRSVLSHLACIPAGYFRSGPDFGPANGAGSAFQGKEAPPYLGCIPAGYFRPGPAFCPTHGVGPFFQVELQTPRGHIKPHQPTLACGLRIMVWRFQACSEINSTQNATRSVHGFQTMKFVVRTLWGGWSGSQRSTHEARHYGEV